MAGFFPDMGFKYIPKSYWKEIEEEPIIYKEMLDYEEESYRNRLKDYNAVKNNYSFLYADHSRIERRLKSSKRYLEDINDGVAEARTSIDIMDDDIEHYEKEIAMEAEMLDKEKAKLQHVLNELEVKQNRKETLEFIAISIAGDQLAEKISNISELEHKILIDQKCKITEAGKSYENVIAAASGNNKLLAAKNLLETAQVSHENVIPTEPVNVETLSRGKVQEIAPGTSVLDVPDTNVDVGNRTKSLVEFEVFAYDKFLQRFNQLGNSTEYRKSAHGGIGINKITRLQHIVPSKVTKVVFIGGGEGYVPGIFPIMRYLVKDLVWLFDRILFQIASTEVSMQFTSLHRSIENSSVVDEKDQRNLDLIPYEPYCLQKFLFQLFCCWIQNQQVMPRKNGEITTDYGHANLNGDSTVVDEEDTSECLLKMKDKTSVETMTDISINIPLIVRGKTLSTLIKTSDEPELSGDLNINTFKKINGASVQTDISFGDTKKGVYDRLKKFLSKGTNLMPEVKKKMLEMEEVIEDYKIGNVLLYANGDNQKEIKKILFDLEASYNKGGCFKLFKRKSKKQKILKMLIDKFEECYEKNEENGNEEGQQCCFLNNKV